MLKLSYAKCVIISMTNFLNFFRGQIGYSVKESCLQDSPPAAGRFSDIIPLRRSAILPGGLFYVIGTLRSNFL